MQFIICVCQTIFFANKLDKLIKLRRQNSLADNQQEKVHALQSIDIDIFECHNTIRHELPTYKMSEIGTHSS